MPSVNKVILIGNLTKDPDIRYAPDESIVANMSLATNETWKDKSGAKQERAEFHRVVCFPKLSDIVAAFLRKGALVYIEGRLQTRKWQDKEGKDRYTTEIVAEKMQMLGGKPAEQEAPAEQKQGEPSDDPFGDVPF